MSISKYETGRVGMSDPEIEAEVEQRKKDICARDPEAQRMGIAYFYLQTPQEIHRDAVISAMKMANTCLCYNDFHGWLSRGRFIFMKPLQPANGSNVPPLTEEQKQAYVLSEQELDAIYAAQSERFKKAKVVDGGVTDPDGGFRYNKIIW